METTECRTVRRCVEFKEYRSAKYFSDMHFGTIEGPLFDYDGNHYFLVHFAEKRIGFKSNPCHKAK